MQHLSGSVGLGGRNRPNDVATVQRLLLSAGVSPGPVDHRCGILTIRAIEHVQHGVLPRPDGRVDVSGPTWAHLQRATVAASKLHSTDRVPPPAPSAPPKAPSPHPPHPQHAAPAVRAAALRTETHPALPASPAHPASPGRPEPIAYWRAKTPLAPWSEVNEGLQSPSNRVVRALLGDPTGPKTTELIVTAHAGPLHVSGLRPAVESLNGVIIKMQQDLSDLYSLVATSGMRAVRAVRGAHIYSNHSWGIAIDIRIGSLLVPLGAQFSMRGLDALVPYFNAAGWYWGGGYHGRKDPMHFECSTSLLQSFRL